MRDQLPRLGTTLQRRAKLYKKKTLNPSKKLQEDIKKRGEVTGQQGSVSSEP